MASSQLSAPATDDWRTYDEFAAGIDTYRQPNINLDGTSLTITLDDQTRIHLAFGEHEVVWEASGAITAAAGTRDPYDAVGVREDIVFLNLPLTSRERESLTFFYSTTTHRVILTRSHIAEEASPDVPQVSQEFWAGVTDQGQPTGEAPHPSRDLIGMRNIYRYSPNHLYEHWYTSSERYAWQNLQGVQRGHGDMDLSTVWKFADGLYLFCFREFRIAVASVWLHDLGINLTTTGIFLGLTGEGKSEHSRAGGHVYPLGQLTYPSIQPI